MQLLILILDQCILMIWLILNSNQNQLILVKFVNHYQYVLSLWTQQKCRLDGHERWHCGELYTSSIFINTWIEKNTSCCTGFYLENHYEKDNIIYFYWFKWNNKCIMYLPPWCFDKPNLATACVPLPPTTGTSTEYYRLQLQLY